MLDGPHQKPCRRPSEALYAIFKKGYVGCYGVFVNGKIKNRSRCQLRAVSLGPRSPIEQLIKGPEVLFTSLLSR
jgi:hypothetical protein